MIVFSVDSPAGFVSAVELVKGTFLPTTATALGRRAFCATHRWETDQEVLTGTVPRPHFRLCLCGRALRSGQVCIYNDRPFTLAEWALLTTSPEAMTFEGRRFAV